MAQPTKSGSNGRTADNSSGAEVVGANVSSVGEPIMERTSKSEEQRRDGKSGDESPPATIPGPLASTLMALAVFVAFAFGAGIFASSSTGAMIGAEAGAALAVVLFSWRNPRLRLGLSQPRVETYLAAVLVGSSMWIINLRITLFLAETTSLPTDAVAVTELATQPALGLTLIALVVLPAVSEELWFRGLWLTGLASRWPASLAVVCSAIVFSLFHLSWAQLPSTLLLGIVLGYMRLRGRSLWPCMVVHLINNFLAVMVTRGEISWLEHWLVHFSTTSVLVAAIAVTAGLSWLHRANRLHSPA